MNTQLYDPVKGLVNFGYSNSKEVRTIGDEQPDFSWFPGVAQIETGMKNSKERYQRERCDWKIGMVTSTL